jgi:hypothetical protein
MEHLKNHAPYFSNKGITASEANHVCNLITEKVKSLSLDKFKFIKKGMEINGGYHLIEGTDANPPSLDSIKSTLEKIGSYYSLSAFLREAIKEKESRATSVHQLKISADRLASQKASKEIEPFTPDNTKFEDTLTISERSKYLELEAKATHFGKFIHNFDKVRVELDELVLSKAVSESGSLIIYKNEKIYPDESINELIDELQKEYRSYEKEVNFWKSKKNKYELDQNLANSNGELKRSRLVSIRSSEIYKELNESYRELENQVSSLRIAIPDNLKEIYEELIK